MTIKISKQHLIIAYIIKDIYAVIEVLIKN